MSESFSRALKARISQGQAPAVVGLDPRLPALPCGLLPDAEPSERIRAFYLEAIPRLAPHIPVAKPNIAFFEQYGWRGYKAYEEVCAAARAAGMLVIGDIKRGDIGSTAAAYAAGHLPLVDAVTLHPYLGSDSLEPFLEGARSQGKACFVLVRTSNPSATEFQELQIDGADLSAKVAQAVHRWAEGTGDPQGYGDVGAVVGATYQEDIARLRELMPRAWFLLPGVGAQGGKVEDVAPAFDAEGCGALVSQSRGVMQAFAPDDSGWLQAIEDAAKGFAAEVHQVVERCS